MQNPLLALVDGLCIMEREDDLFWATALGPAPASTGDFEPIPLAMVRSNGLNVKEKMIRVCPETHANHVDRECDAYLMFHPRGSQVNLAKMPHPRTIPQLLQDLSTGNPDRTEGSLVHDMISLLSIALCMEKCLIVFLSNIRQSIFVKFDLESQQFG